MQFIHMTDSFENNKEVLKISIPLKNSRIDKKCKEYNKYAVGFFIDLSRDLKVEGYQSNLYFMLKQLLYCFFIILTISFVSDIL